MFFLIVDLLECMGQKQLNDYDSNAVLQLGLAVAVTVTVIARQSSSNVTALRMAIACGQSRARSRNDKSKDGETEQAKQRLAGHKAKPPYTEQRARTSQVLSLNEEK